MQALQQMNDNTLPILFFVAFLIFSIAITWWAARKTHSTSDFYTAGGEITPFQNGLALSGEFLSGSALLGMTGLISTVGFRGYIYSIGAFASWPIILFLIAEPVRRIGKYTLTDVLSWRLRQRSVRITAACASIPITLFYLIGQLVAGGSLIKLLFGLAYAPGVAIVGIIMLGYVLFGGMLATTWVQISKAVLMYGGVVLLTFLVGTKFGFNPVNLFAAAAAKQGGTVLLPGSTLSEIGRIDLFSLAIATIGGSIGMPQILSRFFTVRDGKAARMSALYATSIVGTFHLMVLVLGFGAMTLVGVDLISAAGGGGNMAIPLLARLLGGNALFGYVCGMSFATVLAVVAGLTLASATTFAHDVWAIVLKNNVTSDQGETNAARVAAIAIGLIAIGLALLFEGTNIAFLIGLAQALAASANTPALLLALFWKGLTTRGTVAGMIVGSVSAVILIVVSPAVQVDMLHHTAASVAGSWWFFPLNNPAIVTVPLAFLTSVVVSLAQKEPSSAVKFQAMRQLMSATQASALPASGALEPAE